MRRLNRREGRARGPRLTRGWGSVTYQASRPGEVTLVQADTRPQPAQ